MGKSDSCRRGRGIGLGETNNTSKIHHQEEVKCYTVCCLHQSIHMEVTKETTTIPQTDFAQYS